MKYLLPRRKRIALGLAILCVTVFMVRKPTLLEGYSFSRRVTSEDGTLVRLTLSADEKYRIFTPLAKLSPALKEAVLLKEDKHFSSHPGINPFSAVRALFTTYFTGARRNGGSTISMQVARLRFGLHTRSIPGKLWQMVRALQLELHYTKDELFEAYLNLAPYGYNIEGVGAASEVFFHKDPQTLTLPESLALAVLPQNPARRKFANGISGSESLLAARLDLFEEWAARHPEDEERRGLMRLPIAAYGRVDLPFEAPHLAEALLRAHPDRAEIRSTINLPLQKRLEAVLAQSVAHMRETGVRNAAALLVDVPTMEVRASIGSADYRDAEIHGQIDGTRMKRSPGSAMKPFLYALAFEQGLIHPLSMIADTPMSVGVYDPENFDRRFLGPIAAKDALRLSRNVPAIRIAMRLHAPDLYDFLSQAGVTGLRPEREYGLSLVLGGAEVTMRELAMLYATLANGGALRPLRFERNDTEPASAEPVRLLTPEASFLTLDSLRSTPRPEIRTGGPEVYWKTGTSNGYHDAWTAGIVGRYALVVWVGDVTGAPSPSYVGIRTAAPLFFNLVHALERDGVGEDLVERVKHEARLEQVDVCAPTGELYDALCPLRARTWFIPGVSPIARQSVYRKVLVNHENGMRACRFVEGRTDWKVFEFWPSDLRAAFEESGIRKVSLPQFEPGCELEENGSGSHGPRITSPQATVIYQARLQGGDSERIPFLAVSDADVRSLHWFAGKKYLGETSPNEPLLWEASPGTHLIRVMDDQGRADTVNIRVGLAQ